jgi:hypothetical protein
MKTDNELINEFMGMKITQIKEDWFVGEAFYPHYYNVGEMWHTGSTTREYVEDSLEYHCRTAKFNSSWEWLMPVVEKIKNTIGVKSVDECSEEEWNTSTGLTRLTITTPLSVVYSAVVNYIKWYNKNNQ